MEQPDFDRAIHYVMDRLQQGLRPGMVYHSLFHTLEEVLPAIERIAAAEGIHGEDLLLLRTAAAYHDVGFTLQYKDHEAASAALAGLMLPEFGYSPAQIQRIQAMILVTRLPQRPQNMLEQILADADLDILGSQDFLKRNQDLRSELACIAGISSCDRDWCKGQLNFIREHRYFTRAQRNFRDATKQHNLSKMIQWLAATGVEQDDLNNKQA